MISQSSLTKKCRLYFDLFSKKDLDGLSELFSDNVTLRDWEIFASGKKNVLAANKKIFDSVNNIQVKLIDQSLSYNDTVYNEIIIKINNTENLLVVDVIIFDKKGLIKEIKAFKG